METSSSFLDRVISQRNPSHAYLFFGPPSSDKEARAKAFCKTLLCKKQVSGVRYQVSDRKETKMAVACGECISCRKFESGNHPDFREVAQGEDKIKIDDIRALKEEARFAPLESEWKIAFIPTAERMTFEAPHSLLKLLEEPPSYLIFVLTAHHPTSVLSTIASRCQRVPFAPRTHAELIETLEQDAGLPHETALPLSQLDIHLADAKTWGSLVAEAAPILFSSAPNAVDLFEKASALEDYKEEGEKLLQLLLALYRDAAVLKVGWEDGLLFPNFKSCAENLSRNLSWGALWEKSRLIVEAKNHLRHYGNFRLVVENLLWKLRS